MKLLKNVFIKTSVELVKRRDKKRFLGATSKVIYSILLILEDILLYDWKLKAIDSLEMSNELSMTERDKVIENINRYFSN
jgi:hypothetical protein